MRGALPISIVVSVVLGCGGGDRNTTDGRSGGDGAGADGGGASTLTCEQLQLALREKTTTVSRACQDRADCLAVGYAQRDDGLPTCNCAPAFASNCSGAGVNRAAWIGDEQVQDLEAEWQSRCVPGGCAASICVCDCGLGELTCANGACVVDTFNCFPSPDAAVP